MASQKITTFLWFNTEAEDAAKFYVSVFGGDSHVVSVDRMGDAVMSVSFELGGQRYVALNGNTKQTFNDSISLMIACEDQPEVDLFWDKLLAGGGKPTQCGWLKDKFGVSWQVVPNGLMKTLQDKDPVKAGRVFQAFRAMQKIDLAALERARAGTS
ncbi:MAG: VOC family protein [Archangium sp.]|nr:VOC family protein [Archangium sp.]MDP3569252.1 VOC family protein [Archangium sp.]